MKTQIDGYTFNIIKGNSNLWGAYHSSGVFVGCCGRNSKQVNNRLKQMMQDKHTVASLDIAIEDERKKSI